MSDHSTSFFAERVKFDSGLNVAIYRVSNYLVQGTDGMSRVKAWDPKLSNYEHERRDQNEKQYSTVRLESSP